MLEWIQKALVFSAAFNAVSYLCFLLAAKSANSSLSCLLRGSVAYYFFPSGISRAYGVILFEKVSKSKEPVLWSLKIICGLFAIIISGLFAAALYMYFRRQN